ncbi:MAG TPA: DUF58 domain-containing protein [Chryseolinea sp.]
MRADNQHTSNRKFPPEIVATLEDLMQYEYLVQSASLLPTHPVYSILAGRHASKLRGRGLDFEEVRLYVPGDDIRNIDWRVTARVGQTHSKVFNEEKERPTFLVIDQTSTMFFGSQRYTKSVIAAQAAALGAFYTIKRGDRVGGLVFTDDDYHLVMPKRSKALVQYFLQLVSEANEKLTDRPFVKPNTPLLNEMLDRTLKNITHDYVVTVVSDLSNHDNDTKKLLQKISYHNDVIVIHLSDPLDDQLPDGKLVLTDARHQIQWSNTRKGWGQKYKDAAETFRQQFKEELKRYAIPVQFYNTAEPVETQVRRDINRLKAVR